MANHVQLENTEYWTIESQIMDYMYDVKVHVPQEAPPEGGFPIYYVLDGNSYFHFARDVIRLQSGNAPKTGISPAIVVGIGHHGEYEERSKRRFYDFTPVADQYIYPERLKGANIGVHGGADKFLDFLEQELMPVIHKKYRVDQSKQALFGHSLSGLFVLITLFKRPDLFQYYLATSPSIWWNDHEIVGTAERFLRDGELENLEDRKMLLIAVGSKETFMVDDARELYSLINKHRHLNLTTDLYIAEDENHASIVPTIMSRAFRVVHA
ncbi:Ferri-bacillibactin esterase BesA [compost metagenome]